MNKESFVYVVIFTFSVAFIFVSVIALADNATTERVAMNRKLVTAQAFLNAIGQPEIDANKALTDFNEIFNEVVGESIVRAFVNGEEMLVKQFSGQALWGTVTGVLATDATAERIVGLDIISHVETPGLGGRIEEDWFKNQFRNERIGSDGIRVRKGEGSVDRDTENALVDGVTGASLTSAAMEVIINNEINAIKEVVQ